MVILRVGRGTDALMVWEGWEVMAVWRVGEGWEEEGVWGGGMGERGGLGGGGGREGWRNNRS